MTRTGNAAAAVGQSTSLSNSRGSSRSSSKNKMHQASIAINNIDSPKDEDVHIMVSDEMQN